MSHREEDLVHDDTTRAATERRADTAPLPAVFHGRSVQNPVSRLD